MVLECGFWPSFCPFYCVTLKGVDCVGGCDDLLGFALAKPPLPPFGVRGVWLRRVTSAQRAEFKTSAQNCSGEEADGFGAVSGCGVPWDR